MKPLVIVNPKAGGGRHGHTLEQLEKTIERALGSVDFAQTERPRHAVDLAKSAAIEGREVVVATGGDGSIHEVVNGLMLAKEQGHEKTALGIIGRGTGSDLCKTLGLENRLDRFLSVIAAGHTKPIDVGRFSYETDAGASEHAYFVNILSAGMGGLVDRYVRDYTRLTSGPLAYFAASTKALLKSEIASLSVRLELAGEAREVRLETRQIAICNGRFFGSGMKVAPMAEPDDGVFEVIDLGSASRLKFALESSAIYTGAHMKSPDVQHFRCDRVRLALGPSSRAREMLLDVDGEPLGRVPIDVAVVPKALRVLLPPAAGS